MPVWRNCYCEETMVLVGCLLIKGCDEKCLEPTLYNAGLATFSLRDRIIG